MARSRNVSLSAYRGVRLLECLLIREFAVFHKKFNHVIDRNPNQLWRVVVLRIFSAHLALVLMMTTRLISVPISKSFDLYEVKKIKLDKNYVKLSRHFSLQTIFCNWNPGANLKVLRRKAYRFTKISNVFTRNSICSFAVLLDPHTQSTTM